MQSKLFESEQEFEKQEGRTSEVGAKKSFLERYKALIPKQKCPASGIVR